MRAVELGINWIDTAAVYGYGHSEEVVGRALQEIPEADRPLVFTKTGLRQPDDIMRAAERVGDPAFIREEIQASLKRLGVERIDLYQMHWPPDDKTPIEEYWGTLLELEHDGLVRAVGLSNHRVSDLERAEALGHVGSLQPPLSLIRRDAAAEEIPWCLAHETGVIVYSPMQAGLLSGAFSAQRVASLADDDWRKRDANFTGEALARNLALVDMLAPIAERHGTTLASVAIAWTLSVPGVSGAIVGARQPDQIEGWLDAASLELTAADLAEIATAIEATGAGSGPLR